MSADRFDGSTNRPATWSGDAHSRRTVLRGGLTLGSAAFAAMAGLRGASETEASRNFGARPLHSRNQQSTADATIRQKAFDLNYDVEKIFGFVADEVRYDAYAGQLRGAKGTMLGLAGNSADQAQLLSALLRLALVPVRFAIGELDEATAAALLDSTRLSKDAVRRHDLAVQATSLQSAASDAEATPEAATPTAEDAALIKALSDSHQKMASEAATMVATTLSTLTQALAKASVALPTTPLSLPERERRQHVWVQYATGAQWVDLDPTLPRGTAAPTPASTPEELPAESDHRVRIRIVAELVRGGQPMREELISFEAKSSDLNGVAITFTHLSPESFQAVGAAIMGALGGGGVTRIPCLFVGGKLTQASTHLTFGGDGGVFGDSSQGPVDGEPIAEWIEVEVVSPDGTPTTVSREIFDRIGFAARATGPAAIDTPAAVTLVDVPNLGKCYLPLLQVWALMVSTGVAPTGLLASVPASDDVSGLHSTGVLGHLMLRDWLGTTIGPDHGFRLYPDAPNVTAFVLSTSPDAPGQKGSIDADILIRHAAAVPMTDGGAAQPSGLLAAALAHAAERFSLDTSRLSDLSAVGIPAADALVQGLSVGQVFDAAAAQGIGLTTLTTAGAAIPAFSHEATVRISADLAAGYVVVVPERAVAIDGEPAVGWWSIDPTTGAAFDRMENGRGNVNRLAVRPQVTEEEIEIELARREMMPVYRRMGWAVASVSVLAAASVFLYNASGAASGKGESLQKLPDDYRNVKDMVKVAKGSC